MPALRTMAVLANARRDYAGARAWGEAARKLEPERWTTYPPLIEASAGLGDDEETGRLLEKLAKLRTGPEVMARAAAVYRDRGWREDAAAKLTDAASAAGGARRARGLPGAGSGPGSSPGSAATGRTRCAASRRRCAPTPTSGRLRPDRAGCWRRWAAPRRR